MSAADVAHIREMLEVFNRGEYSASIEYLHDDAEMHQLGELPDTGTYIGKDEWIRGLRRWLGGFERGFQFIPEELVDAGDTVFARVTLRGVGRSSGVELEQEVFHVYEVREGKTYRCRAFSDEDQARDAAGLAPR